MAMQRDATHSVDDFPIFKPSFLGSFPACHHRKIWEGATSPWIFGWFLSSMGYVREYPHKILPYMVQYLHFRILEFPLMFWCIFQLCTEMHSYLYNYTAASSRNFQLAARYNKRNMWGNEPCAKFYVAGTVLAFEHLHSRKRLGTGNHRVSHEIWGFPVKHVPETNPLSSISL